MTAGRDLPPDYPLRMLRGTVARGLAIEGHLLTAGERETIARWQCLPEDAAHVFARLLSRRKQPVRLDRFHAPGVTDLAGSLAHLVENGLVDMGDSIPPKLWAEAMTVAELRRVCKTRGLPTSGRRHELLDRLGGPLRPDTVELVHTRHRGLFRRSIRAGLQAHSGELTKAILAEIGVRKPAVYAPTGGMGRWASRRPMLTYEAAARTRTSLRDRMPDLAVVDTLLASPAVRAQIPELRYRFSGKRQIVGYLKDALRAAEKDHHPGEVAARYQALLACSVREAPEVAHRLALCLDRAGDSTEALSTCEAHAGAEAARIKLSRTGRRIARKLDVETALPVPPEVAIDRTVEIPYGLDGAAWIGPDGRRIRVEEACTDWLRARGRRAIYAENSFWTSLFALIYERAFFAPVAGMWPAPLMSHPMDLGMDGFVQRRHAAIGICEEALDTEGPEAVISKAWARRHGQRIAGMHWGTWAVDDFVSVARGLGTAGLKVVLAPFLSDWRSAARGLPDLLLPPGPKVCVNGDALGEGTVFVEIKGPSDTLRDAQLWWIAYLRSHNIPAEVWRLRPHQG